MNTVPHALSHWLTRLRRRRGLRAAPPRQGLKAIARLRGKAKWGVAALLLVMLCGTLGYHWIGGEQHGWIDALYMTFITVTTVGFGEVIDLSHNPGGRVFTMVIGTTGLCSLWFLFSTVTVFLLETDLNATLRRRRMEKRIAEMSGHYIVCGFGRVGLNVASELELTGRKYVAIDVDPALLEERLLRDPELLSLSGDASDDELLLAAGARRAKGLFAVTGDDSLNLMLAITGRQLNPKLRIVARCHEARNISKLRKAGADEVVSPDFTGGVRIVAAMIRPHVVNFLDEMLRSEQHLRFEEVPVPDDFPPRPLGRLHMRSTHYVLLAIRHPDGEMRFNPPVETILQPGDIVIAMCSPTGRQEIKDALTANAR